MCTTIEVTKVNRVKCRKTPMDFWLVQQSKHVWLIVRQMIMTSGWWDAPIALWDLARAISITTFRVWKNNIRKGGGRRSKKGGLFDKGEGGGIPSVNYGKQIRKSTTTIIWQMNIEVQLTTHATWITASMPFCLISRIIHVR